MTIEVIATDRGYYGDRIREKGTKFFVNPGEKGSWFVPVAKKGTEQTDINKLSVPQLKEMAEAQGIEIPARATKSELIALLTSSDASSDDETELA